MWTLDEDVSSQWHMLARRLHLAIVQLCQYRNLGPSMHLWRIYWISLS
jgi:hypothetical protein